MADSNVVDNPTENTPEVIAEAQQYGWVPKDKFRGKDTEWVDAAEYVKRGRNSIPILRSKLTQTESRVNQLLATVSEQQKDLETVRQIGYNQATKEWQEKYDALKAQKKEALETGDHSAAVDLDEAISEHKETKPAAPAKKSDAPVASPEELQWLSENPWYKPNSDDELTVAANAIGIKLAKGGKGLQGVELLNAVKERMEQLFPEELGADATPRTGMTHGTRRRTPPNQDANAKTYENLPDDAKKACDRLVANKRCTREEYVANYQWD